MEAPPDHPRLYTDLAHWWPLLSAPEDYAQDAAEYTALLNSITAPPLNHILELGSGGGNNALHMKQHFQMTLCDIAPAMIDISRKLNPECEHIIGDMRNIRLNQTFDAVFIHDAISYMTHRDELRAAIHTARIHCRPGGAILMVPDYIQETFRTNSSHGGNDASPTRALRYLQWDHDPDPSDEQYSVDFAYLIQDGHQLLRQFETHTCGLFSFETWIELIEAEGLIAGSANIESDELEAGHYILFTGRMPAK